MVPLDFRVLCIELAVPSQLPLADDVLVDAGTVAARVVIHVLPSFFQGNGALCQPLIVESTQNFVGSPKVLSRVIVHRDQFVIDHRSILEFDLGD